MEVLSWLQTRSEVIGGFSSPVLHLVDDLARERAIRYGNTKCT